MTDVDYYWHAPKNYWIFKAVSPLARERMSDALGLDLNHVMLTNARIAWYTTKEKFDRVIMRLNDLHLTCKETGNGAIRD